MGSLCKNVHLTVEFLKSPFSVLHFSCYTLIAFLMLSVILLSMLMTLLSKCDQTSDLWQQLKLASELESDLWDTVDWGKKWLVNFNAGKAQLFLFDWSDNTNAFDFKKDCSVLRENCLLKCWSWLSVLNWIGALTLSLLIKLLQKNWSLNMLSEVPFFEVALYFYKSAICPCMEYCCHLCLEPLVATWNC